MAKANSLVTAGVFAGQIVGFSFMFTMLKVISQTCVPMLPGMTQSKSCPEGEVKFERPVLNALMMVGSMSLSLIFYYFFRHNKAGVPKIKRDLFAYILFPSALDVVCCGLLMAGSMYIPMSLVLTLKGIRILFSSLLVIVIFKRKQRGHNWAGVAVAMLGVGLAALSAVLNSQGDKSAGASSPVLGIVLVLGSEFFRSLMVVTQEYLMKVKRCDPTFLMGLQGVYGGTLIVIMMVVSWLLIPGKDKDGSFENMPVTFELASESPLILSLLSVLPFVTTAGFISSAFVTKLLSSVHNAMASVLMTALVWLIELIIYYGVDSRYGKKWGQFSPLQLVGFMFVVLALLVYDGSVVKIKSLFEYPTESKLDIENIKEIQALASAEAIASLNASTVGEESLDHVKIASPQ